MLVSNSTLESLASRFVIGRKALDDLSQGSFSLIAPTTAKASAAALSSDTGNTASQDTAQDQATWNESFARMMLGLRSQAETTLSQDVADSDNGVASNSQVAATDGTTRTSVQQDFLDYMQQPAQERLREQLTGISKEEYDAMTPEQQQAVDDRFKDALKQRQEVAEDDINTRIKALKAGLIA